jgi:Holliday junction resolvase RusA-like endonuclease
MKLILSGKWPSLNEYIQAERSHRMKAAEMKRHYTDCVFYSAFNAKMQRVTKPVRVHFIWYSINRRMDTDNIRWCKPILDGLVKAGVLPNDSQSWVRELSDTFLVDKDNPRVEVEIEEVA